MMESISVHMQIFMQNLPKYSLLNYKRIFFIYILNYTSKIFHVILALIEILKMRSDSR